MAVFKVESASISKQITLFLALRWGEKGPAVDRYPLPCFL